MDKNEIFTTVAKIINKALLEPKEILIEHNLKEDIGLDSIGYVELGTSLEDIYNVDITDEQVMAFETVADVVDMVLTSPTYA
mgnify:CR=1 FL=1